MWIFEWVIVHNFFKKIHDDDETFTFSRSESPDLAFTMVPYEKIYLQSQINKQFIYVNYILS